MRPWPGRAELGAFFAEVAQELAGVDAAVVVEERRLQELLRRRAATLYVGVLNHCWFVDPSRARCLQKSGQGDPPAPLVALREPTRCANATIHPQHVPVWLDTRRHLDALLASARVPAQEKQRLGAERTRLQARSTPRGHPRGLLHAISHRHVGDGGGGNPCANKKFRSTS